MIKRYLCLVLQLFLHGTHDIEVYVIVECSNPLILGIPYLQSHNMILNFGSNTISVSSKQIKCKKTVVIPPDSEQLIYAEVPKCVNIGQQLLCNTSNFCMKKGIFIAKALVCVSVDNYVPLIILNPTRDLITIHEGKCFAEFTVIDENYKICRPQCTHVVLDKNDCVTCTSKYCNDVENKGNAKTCTSTFDVFM